MYERTSFADLAKRHRPLVLPSAHDALSARLIEMAGFEAFAVSGSALLAARYGLPDLGLAGLCDIASGTRDILSATSLPCMGDGDDGYGGPLSVARTVRENEALGVGALVFEDQSRATKRPGQSAAQGLISEDEMLGKLRAAIAARRAGDLWIIGRTDAYASQGVDAAMARGDLFLRHGADGVFIAGVRKEEDLVRIGARFKGAPLISVMSGAEGWPWLTPRELGDLGFTVVVYPATLIQRLCLTMADVLADLRRAVERGEAPQAAVEEARARAILSSAVQTSRWDAFAEAASAADWG
ncbi:MAG: isocitrate lyase/PEP mutase family protein [Phenylobacterium sp.]